MTEKLSKADHLKSLGSEKTEYKYDAADRTLLERFPNPLLLGPGTGTVNIVSPEFTSLCPKTGQPDFATIVLDYTPRNFCVESKAWKLYLGSFRNMGEFHESCIRRIANDLIWLLDPESLELEGQFTPRGGIPFWPKIVYDRPEHIVSLESFETDGSMLKLVPEKCSGFYVGEDIGVTKDGDLYGFATVLGVDYPNGCGSQTDGTGVVTLSSEIKLLLNENLRDASEIKAKD